MLSAEEVAAESVTAMSEGRFLILPHKEVAKYVLRKATDHERWLTGMSRMHNAFGEFVRLSPNASAAKL